MDCFNGCVGKFEDKTEKPEEVEARILVRPWQIAPLFQKQRSMLCEILSAKKQSKSGKFKPLSRPAVNFDLMPSIKTKRTQEIKLRKVRSAPDVRTVNYEKPVSALTQMPESNFAIYFHEAHGRFNNKDYKQRRKARFKNYNVPVIKAEEFQNWIDDRSNKRFLYIGGGRYGQVYLAKFRGRFCVVKTVREPYREGTNKQVLDKAAIESYQTEVEIMCRLNYTHATSKFYGVTWLRNGGLPDLRQMGDMVMEFIGDESTLKAFTLDYMLKPDPDSPILPRIDIYSWMRMCAIMCRKLFQVHQASIVHCDLKPDNVILKPVYGPGTKEINYLVPYFIDFGLSMDDKVHSFSLTLEGADIAQYKKDHPHVAPELIEKGSGFNKQSDIFAMGMVVKEIGVEKDIPMLRDLGTYMSQARPSLDIVANVIEDHLKSQQFMLAKESVTLLQTNNSIVTFNLQRLGWRKWRYEVRKEVKRKKKALMNSKKLQQKANK